MDKLILIVEDNDEDYEAVLRAFRNLDVTNSICRCADASDCYSYLDRFKNGDAECPALILLDLNLPGTDGRTILKNVKTDSSLRAIPISVMTSSSNPADIKFCYDNGANSMFLKPLHFGTFQQKISHTLQYWLSTVVLP
ncbi:MAG: response regulator [Armatimonas sp.]